MTDGAINKFDGEAVPVEFQYVFLAKWLGVGPWDLATHPEWFDAISVCGTAWMQAEAAKQ